MKNYIGVMHYSQNEEGGAAIFKRLYVCLYALKVDFKDGCRKVIGLDGNFFERSPSWSSSHCYWH